MRRKRRKIDGRKVVAIGRAIAAAEADEEKDRGYMELLAKNLNYQEMAQIIGVSRQRTTYLVNRAVVRAMLLREHRAGKSTEDIARVMEKIRG